MSSTASNSSEYLPIIFPVETPTSGASDPGQRVDAVSEAEKATTPVRARALNISPASDLYDYAVYRPSSITPRVWSGRKTNFYYAGDEGMYSCINRFLEAVHWVQLVSWKNDTSATQTYQYSYTTSLKITEGSEVNQGFDLGASYQGMSIGYNYSQKTFKTTETTSSQTTTISVNVPPNSLVVFYQRRYDFRDEITFICDAWGREWNIGPWGGYSPLVKKTTQVQIMAEEYFTSSAFLANGPGSIPVVTVSPAQITDTTRKRENVTKKSKAVLDKMGPLVLKSPMSESESSTSSTIPKKSFKNLVFSGPISVVPSDACLTDGFDMSFVFLLLGPTGTGKSSFIEALAGPSSKLKISKNQLQGVTQDIVCYQLTNVQWKCTEEGHRHTVYVIDTPGFADNGLSELKMFNMLTDWLKQGPAFTTVNLPEVKRTIINHIIYFHPITSPRMSGSKHGLLKILTALTGGSRVGSTSEMSRITFATTMWDMLRDKEKAEVRYKQLQAQNGPCGTFIEGGSRVVKFENTHESALWILDTAEAAIEHFFRFERMLIKDEHVRDTPFGPNLYALLCDRIEQLASEHASLSRILEMRDDDPMTLQYYAEQLLQIEAQLLVLQLEAQEFGPSPAGSVVSFAHLFDTGDSELEAPSCSNTKSSSPLTTSVSAPVNVLTTSVPPPSMMKLKLKPQMQRFLELILRFPRKVQNLLRRSR
ncbi:hypothetical protein CVT24_006242 [Panaeolus cyanescens]|uniref:G domain-containing protein n=1 Tax=Panaeolus cyanescens TaxID=181874 RepID=A0A409YEJ5_9AGAR|nr:hypothetical protein CVT24_006242 [Panaeolus cyanescens]